MYKNLRFVLIDSDYCNYLRKYDNKVPYNSNNKKNRPFIGILFTINEFEYFAPLSSPKPKHKKMNNSIDFLKIANGKYGVINFNNMIPVMKNNYRLININTVFNYKVSQLLNNQIRWLNKNKDLILSNACFLYGLYKTNNISNNIKLRCCNYPLLEEKCKEYNLLEIK